jgi:hypothetical protein
MRRRGPARQRASRRASSCDAARAPDHESSGWAGGLSSWSWWRWVPAPAAERVRVAAPMKAAANRDAGRRGLPMDPPQTSSDDSDESSDGEEGALLGTKGAAGTKGKAKARVWRRKGHLRLLEPFGACGEWLLSSNNRSAACLVAGAASAVGFTLSGHPHLAVKVGLGLAVVSLYLGLPQSEEDQAEEDELLQELHED